MQFGNRDSNLYSLLCTSSINYAIWTFKWVPRHQNSLPHRLAKWAIAAVTATKSLGCFVKKKKKN